VLPGLVAGAGYAMLKPPMLTGTTLVVLPTTTHSMATQAVTADSDPVLASIACVWPADPRGS
jgi:hypothetical protein